MINDTVQELNNRIAELEEKVHSYENILTLITTGSIFSNEFRKLSGTILATGFSNTLPNQDLKVETEDLSTKFLNFLENSRSTLRSIYDAIPHHILFVDRNGIITLYNRQVALDFKVSKCEYIGKHIKELLKIDEKHIAILQTIESGEEIYNQEILNIHYGIVNTRIIRDIEGQIVRVVGIFHNLNDARESEKLAMSGRIAAGIAHEVRNPLTTVRGYLQFLQEDAPHLYKKLFSELLIPELDRANRIISDFLAITKNAPYKPEPIEINDFLSNYIQQLLFSESVMRKIDIRYNLSSSLDGVKIYFDKNHLVQIFLNLFQNAVDAKKDDQLILNIESYYENNEVLIVFKDNGIGIPECDLPFIFDPFFSTKDEGTGLGLSLSKSLIQNHNGTIRVESNEYGTKFTISLPTKK